MSAVPRVDSAGGWVAVGGGFAAMFVTFGIAYSFGASFAPMAAEFDSGRGATSAVFALTSLTYFGLGALSGAAVDRYGRRRVLFAGAVALGLGLVATSQAQQLWLALITYGLGVGSGSAPRSARPQPARSSTPPTRSPWRSRAAWSWAWRRAPWCGRLRRRRSATALDFKFT